MDVLRAFLATLGKMFFADWEMTGAALASVAAAAALLRAHRLAPEQAPWLLAAGGLTALALGVFRRR